MNIEIFIKLIPKSIYGRCNNYNLSRKLNISNILVQLKCGYVCINIFSLVFAFVFYFDDSEISYESRPAKVTLIDVLSGVKRGSYISVRYSPPVTN